MTNKTPSDAKMHREKTEPEVGKRQKCSSLESMQKFVCKVCLKQWNLDYDKMLQLLDIPRLSTRRKYLKLTTSDAKALSTSMSVIVILLRKESGVGIEFLGGRS